MKKITRSAFIISVFLILLSGCTNKDNQIGGYIPGNPNADTDYYSSKMQTVCLDANSTIIDCFRSGDDICMIEQCYDGFSYYYYIMLFSEESFEYLSHTPIEAGYSLSFCPVGSQYIACATYDGYKLFDKVTGELIRTSDGIVDYDNDNPFVSTINNGFVYITSTFACRFNDKGDLTAEFEYEDIGWFKPYGKSFTEQRGKYYVVSGDSSIYSFDFDEGSITQLDVFVDSSVDEIGSYGMYVDWRDNNIYELEFDNNINAICAYGSHVLIQPAMYVERFSRGYYFLDKEHFVFTYSYPDGLYDLFYIYRDESLNIGEREKICVKGYNDVQDKSLQYAAYLYNTSQEEYFVEIEEYGNDYGYTTAIEAQDSQMRLLHEFSSGNMPDIFYGNGFDYEYLGNAGLVIDMADYVRNSSVILCTSIIPNYYDLMLNDGHCYQLFNGYRINGLFMNKEYSDCITGDFGIFNDSRISAGMRNYYLSSDIVDFALRYPCHKLLEREGFLTVEDIEQLLRTAYEIGLSSSEKFSNSNVVVNGDEDLTVRQTMVGSIGLYASLIENLGDQKYIGYPTIDNTAYTIDPNCLVAISAGSNNKEACFEFIEYLFSEDVQLAVLNQGQLPVNQAIFEEYIDKMSNPELISSDDYAYKYLAYALLNSNFPSSRTLDGYYHMSDESIQDFKDMVYLVDTVNVMDWGMYNIIAEEVESYYIQGKTIPDIASSLHNRLLLYVQENY